MIKTDIKDYIFEAWEIILIHISYVIALKQISYIGVGTAFTNLCDFMKHLKYFLIRRDQVIFTNNFLGMKMGQKRSFRR